MQVISRMNVLTQFSVVIPLTLNYSRLYSKLASEKSIFSPPKSIKGGNCTVDPIIPLHTKILL